MRSSTSTKSGLRARLGDGLGGRDERVRHGDDVSPGCTPAAISAKRSASVPLATPTACRTSQKSANSRSKLVHQRAADESGRPQRAPEDRHQLLFELHVGRDEIQKRDRAGAGSVPVALAVRGNNLPRSFSDWSAASSSLTTRRPAAPSLIGVRSFRMQSTKYSSSTFNASVCSTLGAQTSPER